MSPDGNSVAFVEHVAPPKCGSDRVVIVTRQTRRIVDAPTIATKSNNSETYWISRLRLSDNEDLLVTVEGNYSGAILGSEERLFHHKELNWTAPYNPFGQNSNVVLDDWDVQGNIAVNTDLRNSPSGVDFIRAAKDSSAGAPRSALIARSHVTELGRGVVTTVLGATAVGYFSNPYFDGGATSAIRWSAKGTERLGIGVAFSVENDGLVVGDDRPRLSDLGHPTAWLSKKRIALSSHSGAAYAARNETVVGAIDEHAFAAKLGRKSPKMMALLPASWHRSSAFSIGQNGMILTFAQIAERDSAVVIVPSPF